MSISLLEKQQNKLEYKFNKIISNIISYAKDNIVTDENILFELETYKRRISVINRAGPDKLIRNLKGELWANRNLIRNKNIKAIIKLANEKITNEKHISMLNIMKDILIENKKNELDYIWHNASLLIEILMCWVVAEEKDEKNFKKICEKINIFQKINI